MTVDWYWCEGWESDISQCTYLLTTTYENCADFQTLLPPGEEGEYVYEYDALKHIDWDVETNGAGNNIRISSHEYAKGKRRSNNPLGGYFTHFQHMESYTYSYSQYIYWNEGSNTTASYSGSTATAYVNGYLHYYGNTYNHYKSKSWNFNDIW